MAPVPHFSPHEPGRHTACPLTRNKNPQITNPGGSVAV